MKTINLGLVGLDGNAFSLMGAFKRQASKEGWTKKEITTVLNECMKGDYNHLLVTLADRCKVRKACDY
jgi:formylmethanofuran dehydrogenase subunit C